MSVNTKVAFLNNYELVLSQDIIHDALPAQILNLISDIEGDSLYSGDTLSTADKTALTAIKNKYS